MTGNQKENGVLADEYKLTGNKISIAFCVLTMILSYMSGAMAHSNFNYPWVELLQVLMAGMVSFGLASMLVNTLLLGEKGGTYAAVILLTFWFLVATVRFSDEVGLAQGFCIRLLIASLVTYIYTLVIRRTMKSA